MMAVVLAYFGGRSSEKVTSIFKKVNKTCNYINTLIIN